MSSARPQRKIGVTRLPAKSGVIDNYTELKIVYQVKTVKMLVYGMLI